MASPERWALGPELFSLSEHFSTCMWLSWSLSSILWGRAHYFALFFALHLAEQVRKCPCMLASSYSCCRTQSSSTVFCVCVQLNALSQLQQLNQLAGLLTTGAAGGGRGPDQHSPSRPTNDATVFVSNVSPWTWSRYYCRLKLETGINFHTSGLDLASEEHRESTQLCSSKNSDLWSEHQCQLHHVESVKARCSWHVFWFWFLADVPLVSGAQCLYAYTWQLKVLQLYKKCAYLTEPLCIWCARHPYLYPPHFVFGSILYYTSS